MEEEGGEEEEEDDDETQCTKCGHDDHPETILLCDNCDAGWHLSCLRPPLLSVPEGDWVCPTCEHVSLLNPEFLSYFSVFFHTFSFYGFCVINSS